MTDPALATSDHCGSAWVMKYFGISKVTLWRWLNKRPDLDFPKPFLINGRKYWVKSQIQSWAEAQKVAA